MGTAQSNSARSLDHDDFLLDEAAWSRELAIELARRNEIGPLTDDHWAIIDFVRSYFLEHGNGPAVVRIAKATGLSSKRICHLFPCGIVRGAYRLAGVPRPVGCW